MDYKQSTNYTFRVVLQVSVLIHNSNNTQQYVLVITKLK